MKSSKQAEARLKGIGGDGKVLVGGGWPVPDEFCRGTLRS